MNDLRDILLQSWHYHLGYLTGTEDDYDELTAQLSAGTDIGQKVDAIKVMTPLVEVGASLALVYQQEPRLFSFLEARLDSQSFSLQPTL